MNKNMSIKEGYKYRAFTLVELVVVVMVLMILAAVSFISISNYLAGTRDAKRLNDITEIYSKTYYEGQTNVDIGSLMNVTST
ncbi:MAG: prepilin-type N-terminal cleavage/methylation domain-containing protein [Candidatus Peribacteria bacterium]|jgi:type II secretory pathway pseudopilin PulG|nr:prepilin-type N-terminal cleavage/methylation domain-containing protein [Candidatus Peribacteria bacterium]